MFLFFDQRFSFPRLIVFLFTIFAFFVSSCAPGGLIPTSSTNAPSAVKCDEQKNQIYTGDNYPDFHNQDAKTAAEKIYNDLSVDPARARTSALKLLETETMRWSYAEYSSLDGKPKLRAIVTLISPVLVRALVLNQLLYTNSNPAATNLEQKTNEALAKMGSKNDFAFMLIIQTEGTNTPKTFSVPPAEIRLHNTAGQDVQRTRSDDFLNSPLNFSENLHAGVVFYPMSVKDSSGACLPFIDPNSETSLMLATDKARIDDVSSVTLTWKFFFPLLANLNSKPYDVEKILNPPDRLDAFASPLKELPLAGYDRTSDIIPWREVGRFIWWKMTMDHIPVQ